MGGGALRYSGSGVYDSLWFVHVWGDLEGHRLEDVNHLIDDDRPEGEEIQVLIRLDWKHVRSGIKQKYFALNLKP